MKQGEMIQTIQKNLIQAENDIRKASVFVNQAREELNKICRGKNRGLSPTKSRGSY